MRALALMLAVTLGACSTEFNKSGQDADAGADTPADTAADPVVDTGTDVDTPDPEPPDVRPEPPDEPVEDGVWDALVEPSLDSPACPSLTASMGGVCNIVEQCGCAYGEYCDYTVNVTTCVAWEVCQRGTRGTLGIGEACDTTADHCAPGHICVPDSSGNPICWRWCETGMDCPPGYSCSSGPTVEPCTTPPFMHGVCWPPPD